MQSNTVHDDQPLNCPRCAHDPRGSMMHWADECPLEHTCTECGLTFLWRDVLRPEYTAPWWLVEEGDSRILKPVQFLLTLFIAWIPPLFWRKINLALPFQRRRTMTSIVRVSLLTLMCLWIAWGIVAVMSYRADATRIAAVHTVELGKARRSLNFANRSIVNSRRRLGALEDDAPDRDAYIRAVDRFTEQSQSYSQDVTNLQNFDPSLHPLKYVARHLFLPFSAEPSHDTLSLKANQVLTDPVHWWNGNHSRSVVPSPRRTLLNVFSWDLASTLTRRNRHTVPIAMICITVGMPLYLLALPASRRKAKVKRHHIARISAYSLYTPLSIAIIIGAIIAGRALNNTLNSEWVEPTYNGLCMILIPWAAVWWYCALRQYLRIPHPAAIVASGFFIIFSLTLGLITLLNPIAW